MTQLEQTYMERMPRLLYQLVEELTLLRNEMKELRLALLRNEMKELRAELKDFEKK